MEFLSLPFSALIIIAFILYYVYINKSWQRVVLLASSAVFIGFYHWQYLLYAVAVTLFTFYWGKYLHSLSGKKASPYVLTAGISALVGLWLITRYFTDMFPLGISFYTFQAISYLIEIYWEEEPEESLADFSIYMMLFMKFLSGPIERSYDFLPQLKTARLLNYKLVTNGMLTVAVGAFMKLVLANKITGFVDSAFADVYKASNFQLLVATLVYPMQLYADFAGYTLMALGIGSMFGFKLSPNFDRPFISLTTGELWRRWHQSLSFWVRDYVFTTLSASLRRYKEWGVYFSLLVTFVVIGVWHGAGWAFAIYGLFQALVIMAERFTEKQHNALQQKLPSFVFKPFMIAKTYVLFALSLLFFRVVDLTQVWHIYTHMFSLKHISLVDLYKGATSHDWLIIIFSAMLLFAYEHYNEKKNLIEYIRTKPTLVRWAIYFAIVLFIFRFGAFGVENFIYVQF